MGSVSSAADSRNRVVVGDGGLNVSSCFEKLIGAFRLVHIHPNNCCPVLKKGDIEISLVMELSFISRKRVQRTTHYARFPHQLVRITRKEGRSFCPIAGIPWLSGVEGVNAQRSQDEYRRSDRRIRRGRQ